MMERTIIAAVADNGAIGRGNALLWHISEDLKFFKRNTSGCTVIMGRKTFESLGRPLPKRLNIVVSRNFEAPEGVYVASSLDEAFTLAANLSPEKGMSVEKCFVIGGGQIYSQAMQTADRLVLTRVHVSIDDADTFFPDVDSRIWKEESRSEVQTDPETGYDFEFVTYIRK
ncbi:MAG: dihydrofolate reductase [Candidatus Cryptobacteroides sp.]